jgi:heme/copper-type cytochrome/quinol oxidase subunit 2
MSIVDILVTIVVVTILVTIVLAVVTYVAYKLRLAREPKPRDGAGQGLNYFVRFDPSEVQTPEMTIDRPRA